MVSSNTFLSLFNNNDTIQLNLSLVKAIKIGNATFTDNLQLTGVHTKLLH